MKNTEYKMNGTRTCTLRNHSFIRMFLSRLSFLKLGYFLIFNLYHSQSLLISIAFRVGFVGKSHIKKIPSFEYYATHLIYGRSTFYEIHHFSNILTMKYV